MENKQNSSGNKNSPLAYSYLRFSRAEQAAGNSIERQISASRAYAAKHGLTLVDEMEDHGVSAFHGKNLDYKNALGAFCRQIKEGKIPVGSYLLVESLDRLSRQDIRKAQTLFNNILDAGITIVTLQDGERQYRPESNDISDIVLSLLLMSRAHEESVTKSKRLCAAWKAKREKAKTQKLTKRCPAWLALSHDRNSFDIIDDRVKMIKAIYQMAADGKGNFQIARTLNAKGIPAWLGKKGWHLSSVHKLLTNRAVIGEFQPYYRKDGRTGKRVPAGDVIKDYYPAVIDSGLFQRVTAIRAERKKRPGKTGPGVSNIFSHLCKCGYCGNAVTYVNKGKWKYLVCESARRGHNCPYASWVYADFESTFLNAVRGLDLTSVLGKKNDTSLNALYAKQAVLTTEKDRNASARSNLASAIESGVKLPTLIARLSLLEAEWTALELQLKQVDSDINKEKHELSGFNNVSDWEKVIAENGTDLEFRLRLREEIRRKVGIIKMYVRGRIGLKGNGLIGEIDWKKDATDYREDARQMEITFNNGTIMLLGRDDKKRPFCYYFKSEDEDFAAVEWDDSAANKICLQNDEAQ
jgi:DNA invertase Pin-like site-specific DNA recombinase